MGHVLYQIFKMKKKKHEKVSDNPLIRVHVYKKQNRITFRIKTGYYLQLLTHKMMKLLGITKNKIFKDKNSEMCLIQKLLN